MQRFDHTLCAEKFIFGICRLCHTVRIHEHLGAGLQLQLILPVAGHIHAAQDKSMPVFKQFKLFSRLLEGGIFMACIGCGQFSRGDLQDTQPDRHKHSFGIAGTDLSVDNLKHFRGAFFIHFVHGRIADQSHGDHHKKGGRNAFAGNIRNHHPQVVVIDQKEIIKVTADLLGGRHRRKKVKFLSVRKGRELFGQRAQLNACRKRQLRFNPLFFQG